MERRQFLGICGAALAGGVPGLQGQSRSILTRDRAVLKYGGRPIVLTGYGTYGMVAESESSGEFNYNGFFQHVLPYKINFVRVWVCYHWAKSLTPFVKSGGKYDLTRLNDTYFQRLQDFVRTAEASGIIVQVCLIDPIGVETEKPNRWAYSPFNSANNVNGYLRSQGDFDNVGHAIWSHVHTKVIDRTVDTLSSFGNVIYEVANEPDISQFPISRQFSDAVISRLRSRLQNRPGSKLISVNPSNVDWGFNHSSVDIVSVHLNDKNLNLADNYNEKSKPVIISTDGYRNGSGGPVGSGRPANRADDLADLFGDSVRGAAKGHKHFEVLDNTMLGSSWSGTSTDYDPVSYRIDRELLAKMERVVDNQRLR